MNSITYIRSIYPIMCICLLFVSCNKDNGNPNSPMDIEGIEINGNWTATIQDTINGIPSNAVTVHYQISNSRIDYDMGTLGGLMTDSIVSYSNTDKIAILRTIFFPVDTTYVGKYHRLTWTPISSSSTIVTTYSFESTIISAQNSTTLWFKGTKLTKK